MHINLAVTSGDPTSQVPAHAWRPPLNSHGCPPSPSPGLALRCPVCSLPSPVILASLTSLRSLRLQRLSLLTYYTAQGVSGLSAELDTTLHALPHLKSLLINVDSPGAVLKAVRLPDCLSTLTSLERFCWEGSEGCSLPAGPWLSGMKELVRFRVGGAVRSLAASWLCDS